VDTHGGCSVLLVEEATDMELDTFTDHGLRQFLADHDVPIPEPEDLARFSGGVWATEKGETFGGSRVAGVYRNHARHRCGSVPKMRSLQPFADVWGSGYFDWSAVAPVFPVTPAEARAGYTNRDITLGQPPEDPYEPLTKPVRDPLTEFFFPTTKDGRSRADLASEKLADKWRRERVVREQSWRDHRNQDWLTRQDVDAEDDDDDD
jgi:hypothetical protein